MNPRPNGYVLVAESDKALARLLVRDLADVTGLDVRAVHDGLSGHDALFRDGPPKLLVTEIALPKRDGVALMRALRRLETTGRTPTIALAGSATDRTRVEALRAELGPIEVVPSPASTEVLRRVWRKLCPVGAPVTMTPPAPSTTVAPPSARTVPSPSVPPPPRVPTIPVSSSARASALRFLEIASGAMPCGLLVFDEARRVAVVNAAFEELFGLRPGELLGTRREVLLSRLASIFAEPDVAMALCTSPATTEGGVTADLVLVRPSTRTVRWTTTSAELDGAAVQVVTCYDLARFSRPVPVA
jgi:CheY-like chemotaxis protein